MLTCANTKTSNFSKFNSNMETFLLFQIIIIIINGLFLKVISNIVHGHKQIARQCIRSQVHYYHRSLLYSFTQGSHHGALWIIFNQFRQRGLKGYLFFFKFSAFCLFFEKFLIPLIKFPKISKNKIHRQCLRIISCLLP